MNKVNRERLRNILLDEQRRKYPNMEERYLIAEIAPDTNEKGIKKNIKQWCKAMGFKYTETNSSAKASVKIETLQHASGVSRQHTSIHYRKSEFEKGHHDIEISKNNRLFCIEIKAQNAKTKYKDKQSDIQIEFAKKMKDNYGNDYYIITGFDDFFSLYDAVIVEHSTT